MMEKRVPLDLDNREEPKPNNDPTNHPPHYNQGGIECIDAIKEALSPEEFRGFLKGNTIKYIWRSNHKGSHDTDIKKAIWYLNRLNKDSE